MFKLSNVLKSMALLLIIIQLAPPFLSTIKKQYRAFLEPQTKVGVLCINESFFQSQSYVHELRDLFKNKEIKAIALRMNCPGGYPGSAQAFYNELRTLKQEYTKPVGVYIENMCTSAGYYIACAADFIVATPSAYVGNIGVYIPQPHLKEFINQYKINYSVTQTGSYKTAGDMLQDTTEHGQKMLQSLTDDTYRQFIHDVAQARPQLTLESALTWADGKTFTGNMALNIGLVDAIGSQSTLEAMLRKKTPIDGEIEWIYTKKNKGIIWNLLNNDEDQDSQSLTHSILTHCIAFISHACALAR